MCHFMAHIHPNPAGFVQLRFRFYKTNIPTPRPFPKKKSESFDRYSPADRVIPHKASAKCGIRCFGKGAFGVRVDSTCAALRWNDSIKKGRWNDPFDQLRVKRGGRMTLPFDQLSVNSAQDKLRVAKRGMGDLVRL